MGNGRTGNGGTENGETENEGTGNWGTGNGGRRMGEWLGEGGREEMGDRGKGEVCPIL